jgi:hypothetical protein
LKKCFRPLGQRGRARRLGDAHEELREAWAPPASEGGSHRFDALQPIFDRRRKLFGYEVLSGSKWENRFTGNPDTATQIYSTMSMIACGSNIQIVESSPSGRSLFSCCRKRAGPPPGKCRRCTAPPDPAKPVPIHFSLQQPGRCSPFSGFTPRFDARVTTDADLVVELPWPRI